MYPSSSSPASSSSPRFRARLEQNRGEVPWNELSRSLKAWLASLIRAQACGQHIKVLKLMEVLVTFLRSTRNASFLHLLAPGQDVVQGLQVLGATQAFIDSFQEMLCVVNVNAATILSFGASAEAVQALREVLLTGGPRGGPVTGRSRIATEPSTRRRSRSLPHLAQETADRPMDVIPAWGANTEGVIARVDSIEQFRLPNAIIVLPEDLAIDVIEALSESRAMPFMVFRWLTTMYIEVLFCVQYGHTTYVLGSKIVYVGVPSGTQIEGTLGLPTTEKEKIMDVDNAIEWRFVAGLLESSMQVIS